MGNDRVPEKYRPGREPPVPAGSSEGRVVARGTASRHVVTPERPSATIYGPADLTYTDQPDRDTCWKMLGGRLRDRLLARAGEVHDWWAVMNYEERIHAAVLGARGLAIADPTLNARGGPAHKVQVYEADPDSFRVVDINEAPRPSAAGGRYDSSPSSPARSRRSLGLNEATRALLGNLPERAQELLQAPFLDGESTPENDHYYYREEHHQGNRLVSIRFFVACYFVNERWLTFASGLRTTPYGMREDLGAWHLVCRRAKVLPRGEQITAR